LGDAEERWKQQRVDADAGLDQGVEGEQARRATALAGALDEIARGAAEQGVAGREPAEEDGEHGRGGLAVGTEQRRQVLLPGHLVDEARKSGQHREQQRGEADHRFGPIWELSPLTLCASACGHHDSSSSPSHWESPVGFRMLPTFEQPLSRGGSRVGSRRRRLSVPLVWSSSSLAILGSRICIEAGVWLTTTLECASVGATRVRSGASLQQSE
jgi:hypothetical protein